MDVILNNPLASMYGPYFLAFYGVLIAAAVGFLWILGRSIDRTGAMPLPQIPATVDPFEIAYLRGQETELARAAVFSLINKGLIEFSESRNSVVRKKADASSERLTKIERITLDWIGGLRMTSEIFSEDGLLKQLEPYAREYRHRLERSNLLIGESTRNSYAGIKRAVLIVLLGLAGYKVLAAVMNGRFNIIFLLILGYLGYLAIKKISSLPRISKLGESYLSRLQLTFADLKNKALPVIGDRETGPARARTTLAGIDPLLLSVGVFGSAVLAGTVYDSYNQVFARSYRQQSESSGHCGAGCGICSSCSGVSSGSSCSSCSSCGGGCGGCGGCS